MKHALIDSASLLALVAVDLAEAERAEAEMQETLKDEAGKMHKVFRNQHTLMLRQLQLDDLAVVETIQQSKPYFRQKERW